MAFYLGESMIIRYRYSSHYIINIIKFISLNYYVINLDIILSPMVFSNLYVRPII